MVLYHFMVLPSVVVNKGITGLFLFKLHMLFLANSHSSFKAKCRWHHLGEDFQIPK